MNEITNWLAENWLAIYLWGAAFVTLGYWDAVWSEKYDYKRSWWELPFVAVSWPALVIWHLAAKFAVWLGRR